jgi:RNA polymerase sigma-70 factor, ECF subfamily
VELSDETLCRRVAEGDEGAFEELVERHQRRAYRVAWGVLGDADEAKDVSQEAFLRLYERASKFDGRSKFTTWFHRIVVNLSLDRRRQRRGWLRRFLPGAAEDRAVDPVDPPSIAVEDPATEVDRRQAMSRIWEAARGLSPQQRAALVLQVQEDLSTAEIANVLECSEATVRVHLHRAVTTLREIMARERR